MSYVGWLEFYLLHTRSVVVVHVMRVLVELVRCDCGSLKRPTGFSGYVKQCLFGIFSNMVEASMLNNVSDLRW